jgi:hypothetical protein
MKLEVTQDIVLTSQCFLQPFFAKPPANSDWYWCCRCAIQNPIIDMLLNRNICRRQYLSSTSSDINFASVSFSSNKNGQMTADYKSRAFAHHVCSGVILGKQKWSEAAGDKYLAVGHQLIVFSGKQKPPAAAGEKVPSFWASKQFWLAKKKITTTIDSRI